MKKTALFLASLVVASTIHAQGNFNFNNVASSGTITIDPFCSGPEGLGGEYVGTGYTASLFYGPSSAVSYGQLTLFPSANAVFFGAGVADPDQSSGAGLFDGGNITLPMTGNAVIGVAVWWSGPGILGVATSYDQALADGYNVGQSPLLTIPLATGVQFPVGLDNLQSFQVSCIPEPTTLALCGLGAAALLLFRRKK